MQEAGRLAAPGEADDEDGVLVAEAEQGVERHHESALGRITTPRARDVLEFRPQRCVELARPQHPRGVARVLEPVHRLAHLADRATLEREGGGLDDGFVAVVQRMEASGGVERQEPLRGAEDRDTPVARVRMLDECGDQVVEPVVRADRVAGDDCDAADDAVGEERGLVVVEEVRLVGSQDERRERVDSPRVDECTRDRALALVLADAVAPRREPARDDPCRRRDPEQQQ